MAGAAQEGLRGFTSVGAVLRRLCSCLWLKAHLRHQCRLRTTPLSPADIVLHANFDECPACAGATVHDKANMGKTVRYYLRFDDDVVSGGWR